MDTASLEPLADPPGIRWDHHRPVHDVPRNGEQCLAGAWPADAASCFNIELRIVRKANDAQAISRQKPILRIFELGTRMRPLVDIDERMLPSPDREDAAVAPVDWRKTARLPVRNVLDPAQHPVLAAVGVIAHAGADCKSLEEKSSRFSAASSACRTAKWRPRRRPTAPRAASTSRRGRPCRRQIPWRRQTGC